MNTYIIDGSRTPFLKSKGVPGPLSAADLAVQTGNPLLARQAFSPDKLDEVIIGCVAPAVDEANIARLIALRLGCGESIPAWTVQRNCASGMQAIDTGMQRIQSGQADLVLVGGTEAMSHYPVQFNKHMLLWLSQWMRAKTLGCRVSQLSKLSPKHFQWVVALLTGLNDPVVNLSMGQTAELLAEEWQISRDMMDLYALNSHERLANAVDEGRFDEITPLYLTDGQVIQQDQGLRRNSSFEQLGKLRPVFDRPYGSVTAGNAAQVSDGAALLILASERAVEKYDLSPKAKIVDTQWAGLDPAHMGLGPVYAMSPLMQRQQLATSDIDYFEINEAFAGQVLACMSAWTNEHWCRDSQGLDSPNEPIDLQKLNVDGGAISMGHPLGASGARIVLHLMHVLEQRQGQLGMASLCIGGGQGGALLLERGETS